jgi:hypothetical protein
MDTGEKSPKPIDNIAIGVNNTPTGLSNHDIKWSITTDHRLIIKKPLQINWEPKEDITTYELAQCQNILMIISRGPIMPEWIDMTPTYMRHFNIIDPNK